MEGLSFFPQTWDCITKVLVWKKTQNFTMFTSVECFVLHFWKLGSNFSFLFKCYDPKYIHIGYLENAHNAQNIGDCLDLTFRDVKVSALGWREQYEEKELEFTVLLPLFCSASDANDTCAVHPLIARSGNSLLTSSSGCLGSHMQVTPL